MKLNIGCGKDIRPGFINIDKRDFEGVDLILDIEHEPLPYKTDSVEEILAINILEHITNLEFLMFECHRVLKPQGALMIEVPHFSSAGAFKDTTHVRYFTAFSFVEMSKGVCYDSLWRLYHLKIIFSKKRAIYNRLIESIANRFMYVYEFTFLRNLFPAMVIRAILSPKGIGEDRDG